MSKYDSKCENDLFDVKSPEVKVFDGIWLPMSNSMAECGDAPAAN